MSVFICWSGERSFAVAKAVQELLEANGVPVFLSDEIEKGTAWFASILDRLRRAKAGIVCLTPENLQSPWMHFEAGALAHGLSIRADTSGGADPSRPSGAGGQQGGASPPSPEPTHPARALFPVLHGVTPAEINGPLSAYQATSTTQREWVTWCARSSASFHRVVRIRRASNPPKMTACAAGRSSRVA
jgi:hypothetical protein